MSEQLPQTTNPEIEKIKLTIKQLDGEIFTVEVMKDASILGLKLMISQTRNIPIERQRLIFRAQELRNNEFSLSQYGLIDGSIVHIVIRPIANVDVPPAENHVVVNVPYANPAEEGAPHHIHPLNVIQQDIDVLYWVKICRFIKIMALINAMFLFLLGLSYFPIIILCLLSISGYVGAKYLRRSYLFLYLVCLFLDIGLRIYFMYLGGSNGYNIVFLSIIILIDLFLFRYTVLLYKIIPSFTVEVRNQIIMYNRVGFF